jgi:hypothetical protein
VIDEDGKIVPSVELEWFTKDRLIFEFDKGDHGEGTGKGITYIWCCVQGTTIESIHIPIEVWIVDHVLLTPRSLEIPLGKRQQITAQVTNDEGLRATDVLLNWSHDAPDPLIVRISPKGNVTGNRIGRTSISAGTGNENSGGVWARIRAEVTVIANPKENDRGKGFPKLLMTDRDVDPETGTIRPLNIDQPTLWQEVSDYLNNIWWLNLGSPEAAFYCNQRADNPTQWRAFHAKKVIDMVVQVHMQEEYSAKGDNERPDLWGRHKLQIESFEVLLMQVMWDKMQPFILTGKGLN